MFKKKKAEPTRISKRSLKIINESSIKPYEANMSTRDIVSDVLSECVGAVAEKIANEGKKRYEEGDLYIEHKEPLVERSINRKRKKG